MIFARYDPVNLFDVVPKSKLELDPELTQLDEQLRDGVRVVSLLLRWANRELSEDVSCLGKEAFRTTLESV
jgi:hypothetical protein